MDLVTHAEADTTVSSLNCEQCGRSLTIGRSFAFKVQGGGSPTAAIPMGSEVIKCLRCAMLHFPMLKRSLAAALVVGTVLTALNQGDTLLAGHWSSPLYWKIPLTYCVPLMVATYGALTNSRK